MKISVLKKISVALSILAALPFQAAWADSAANARADRQEQNRIAHCLQMYGNMNCVPPKAGFLQGLRELCDQYGTVFIIDEVMTGFRVLLGGAQAYYNVNHYLTCQEQTVWLWTRKHT